MDLMKSLKEYLKKNPFVDSFLKQFIHRWRYRKERKLLKGNLNNACLHPSIIHFSFNKAATQHIKSVLRRCSDEEGMIHIKLNDYAFKSEFPFLDHLSFEEMKKYKHVFEPYGYLYSVFGGMVNGIPQISKFKIVLVVRDPRDILVSGYYSMKFSHTVPPKHSNKRKKFLEKRKKAKNYSIDKYVIEQSNEVIGHFFDYQNYLLGKHPNIFITKFEDMVRDYKVWLKKLLAYCELDVSSELFELLIEENKQIKPKKENVHNHLRKGRVGDYKQKLKTETIKCLNKKLSPMLNTFEYSDS